MKQAKRQFDRAFKVMAVGGARSNSAYRVNQPGSRRIKYPTGVPASQLTKPLEAGV